MNIFKEIMRPTLVYDGENLEQEIIKLEQLKSKSNDEGNKKITNDIKLLQLGLKGEKNIIYELLNSHIPMYIFHDVYMQFEDLKAQFDFIVLTEYKIFVIECKYLSGNIVINNDGTFIRELCNKKEGMYSPVTQNERHIKLLYEKIISKQSFIWKLICRNFKDNFHSIVVFAEPKCIIKKGRAPKKIKDQVIRADNLIEYIKKYNKDDTKFSKEFMDKFIEFIKINSIVDNRNLEKTYEKYLDTKNDLNLEEIKNMLKQYRLNKSKELNIEPYKIFTNQELEDIINCLPKSTGTLKQIKGFGNYKITTYGQDIINIINEK